MGAAMLKSCFPGDLIEPHHDYQHSPTSDTRSRYDASYRRTFAKTMSSFAASSLDARHVNRRCATTLQSPDNGPKCSNYHTVLLPQSALRLEQLNQDVAKHRKSLASITSSEAATSSESSFVADSPSQGISPIRRFRPIIHASAAGFRSLLPNDYVLECVTGKGTTSTCYKTVRRTDGQRFACKIIEKKTLAPHARKRREVAAQLRREVDALRRVDHPHIAKLEESFEDDNYLILIMELMEGGELFDAIVERGRFSEREAIRVALSLLSAIQHMHERGVMHRDLKPENVLLVHSRYPLTSALNVKIIDFGFAKILKEGATSTTFLGTGGYLAPEILLSQAYGSSVDMWSIGVLTYLMLCGRLPFAATTKLRPTEKIQTLYKLTFPKKYWYGVSPVAIDFLKRVLVHDPCVRLTATEALQHAWLQG